MAGCAVLELDRSEDARGFFARSFCASELAAAGIDMTIVQSNWSGNRVAGTLRGMHYQLAPHGEPKIVSCVRGRALDVFVDVRPESPTYLAWDSVELDEVSLRAVYLPIGIAHGFQTLADDTLLQYFMGATYEASAARGLRYDDPTLAISWPLPPREVSTRDQSWPLLARA